MNNDSKLVMLIMMVLWEHPYKGRPVDGGIKQMRTHVLILLVKVQILRTQEGGGRGQKWQNSAEVLYGCSFY